MATLVSNTERSTLAAAYSMLSLGAMATRLRMTAGPPVYRKPSDALLGLNVRTPKHSASNKPMREQPRLEPRERHTRRKPLRDTVYRDVAVSSHTELA